MTYHKGENDMTHEEIKKASEEVNNVGRALHMIKVAHADGYLERHALDAAYAALIQIDRRINSGA